MSATWRPMASPMQPVIPAGAAPPRGHYSPGLRAGPLLFVSGQLAFAADGTPMGHLDLAGQTRQALANLRAVVEAAGGTLAQVAKVTVYLASADGWPLVNEVYAEFFAASPVPPARSTVQVAALPKGALVEIDAIAIRAA